MGGRLRGHLLIVGVARWPDGLILSGRRRGPGGAVVTGRSGYTLLVVVSVPLPVGVATDHRRWGRMAASVEGKYTVSIDPSWIPNFGAPAARRSRRAPSSRIRIS